MKGKVFVVVLLVCVVTITHAEPTVWYVHPDSSLNSIQRALNACFDNDIVLVGPGTYHENIIWPNTQGIHLVSELGSELTIIDGGSSGRVITIDSTAHVNTTTVISGFTIKNGYAQYPVEGGGISCEQSSPVISGTIITNNLADISGGGISCWQSSSVISGNTITNNHVYNISTAIGGGLHISNSSLTIIGNDISENDAVGMGSGYGGGLACYNSTLIVRDNSITDNSAHGQGVGGGGMWCDLCYLVSTNNCFSGNSTDGWAPRAGGISLSSSSAIIESCTVSNNDPSGVEVSMSDDISINYCDIYDNGQGVENNDDNITIGAENNWWGDASGPYHPDSNPGGLGDSVSDYVDFTPWLTEPVGVKEKEVIKVDRRESRATIFSGPLRLPEGKKYRVFDITGRVVTPDKMRPGIYFIEVDGIVRQKVIKVR